MHSHVRAVVRTMWSRWSIIALSRAALFHRADHVVDGRLHLGVRERHVAALRGHRVLAGERAVVELVLAVHEVWGPLRLVAELRRAGDAGAVAGHAGALEHLLAVGLRRGLRRLRLGRGG